MDTRTNKSKNLSLNLDSLKLKRLKNQYIFFTGWGLVFLLVAIMMLIYSLIHHHELLLLYALFIVFMVLLGLLFTHENLSKLHLTEINQGFDLTSGQHFFDLMIHNFTPSKKRKILCKIQITDQQKNNFELISSLHDFHPESLTKVNIKLSPSSTKKYSSLIFFQKYSLKKASLETFFPFGLMRSWIPIKMGRPFEFILIPEPLYPEEDTLLLLKNMGEDARSFKHLKTYEHLEVHLHPYTSGPANRIDWLRLQRTGEIFERATQRSPGPQTSSSEFSETKIHDSDNDLPFLDRIFLTEELNLRIAAQTLFILLRQLPSGKSFQILSSLKNTEPRTIMIDSNAPQTEQAVALGQFVTLVAEHLKNAPSKESEISQEHLPQNSSLTNVRGEP